MILAKERVATVIVTDMEKSGGTGVGGETTEKSESPPPPPSSSPSSSKNGKKKDHGNNDEEGKAKSRGHHHKAEKKDRKKIEKEKKRLEKEKRKSEKEAKKQEKKERKREEKERRKLEKREEKERRKLEKKEKRRIRRRSEGEDDDHGEEEEEDGGDGGDGGNEPARKRGRFVPPPDGRTDGGVDETSGKEKRARLATAGSPPPESSLVSKRSSRPGRASAKSTKTTATATAATEVSFSPSGPAFDSTALRSSSGSPFRRIRVRTVVSLIPSSLSDVRGNIERLSCEAVTRYAQGLGGVLLAVENVRLLDHDDDDDDDENGDDDSCVDDDGSGGKLPAADARGKVMNELPWIHFRVEARAVVFDPDAGTKLTGVVNESFPSHVGALVCGFLNASVSADAMRGAGYVYDGEEYTWRKKEGQLKGEDEGDGEGLGGAVPQTVNVSDRITFVLQRMHECSGIVSLEGTEPTFALGGGPPTY